MRVCDKCGAPMGEGVETCPACGASVRELYTGPSSSANEGDKQKETDARAAGIRPGYSKKFDTPEFQQVLESSNRTNTRITLLALLLLPPVLLLIAMLVVHESFEIMVLSCVVIYVLIAPFVLYRLIRRNTAKPWEGTVVDLKLIRRWRRADTSIITCRTKEGKTVKVKEYVTTPLHDYLKVGDRVRYHPRLSVPLEKYDKTHDSYLICPFCMKPQALTNDNCDKCGKPLLK